MCNFHVSSIQANVEKSRKIDPTRTAVLRTAFVRDLFRRFKELVDAIKKAIIEEDVLNLRPEIYQANTPGKKAYKYQTDKEKLDSFVKWLEVEANNILLEYKLGKPWTDRYVADAYKRGLKRAQTEMRIGGMIVPQNTWEMSLFLPYHGERYELVAEGVYNELKGITADMLQKVSRVLSQGLIEGTDPELLAQKLVSIIEGTGMGELNLANTIGRFIPAKRRAEIMARTEIIRSHHLANIQEYRNYGVKGVNVIAEFVTAKDLKVCSVCSSMDGQFYTLEEIETMIPVHAQCRCFAKPYIQK